MEKNPVIAIDLGGTKVLVGVVDPEGQVKDVQRESIELDHGPVGVLNQLARIILQLKQTHPDVSAVGLASAGPLNPEMGCWLDPTNLRLQGEKHWGEFFIAPLLQEKVNLPVFLENDAAAAARAEQWLGEGKGCAHFVLLTLGTGLGVGVIVNNQLVRSGRGLHPEVGHVFLHAGDKTAPCGCGNFGCAEAYLSGTNFTRRWSYEWREPNLTGEILVHKAKKGEQKYLKAFNDYSERLAQLVSTLVVLYAPEKVILSGGFSSASDLFLPQTREKLHLLLASRRVGIDLMPELLTSSLGGNSGLLGGAHLAFASPRVRHFN